MNAQSGGSVLLATLHPVADAAGVDRGGSFIDGVDLFIEPSTVPRICIAPIGEWKQWHYLIYVSDVSRSLHDGKRFSEAHGSGRFNNENVMLYANGIGPDNTLNDLFSMGV